MQVVRLKPERAAELYRKTDDNGKAVGGFVVGRSVDYHRNALGNAKGFLAWCVVNEWTTENALEKVAGVGKRSAGKLQLTGDEARKFHVTALRLADQGDDGALAADMLLSMGLRQSEVRKRRVRDLDLDGTVLRIEFGKTKKSNRVVAVPDSLRARLVELTEDRGALDVLFAGNHGEEHTRAWLYFAVRRVCDAAKVPRVCPHGLRGTFSTLGMQEGLAVQAVQVALGHESASTTLRHYVANGVAEAAQAQRAFAVISGGRR